MTINAKTAVKRPTYSALAVGKNVVNALLMKCAPTVKNIVSIAGIIGAIHVSLAIAVQ